MPGLDAYMSADGIHWKKLGDNPVLTAKEVGSVEGTKATVLRFAERALLVRSRAEILHLLPAL